MQGAVHPGGGERTCSQGGPPQEGSWKYSFPGKEGPESTQVAKSVQKSGGGSHQERWGARGLLSPLHSDEHAPCPIRQDKHQIRAAAYLPLALTMPSFKLSSYVHHIIKVSPRILY